MSQIKNIILSGNAGISDILSYNNSGLLSMNPTQVIAKANERSGKNINLAKIQELSGRIEKTNEGLDSLFDYINSLSINNVGISFASIIKSENLKNQKVEILNTWKSDINQRLDDLTTEVGLLKSTFVSSRVLYNSIGQIQNSVLLLQGKKNSISLLQ
ncbi:MAG: hypothetical protein WCP92_05275 [bacterium]